MITSKKYLFYINLVFCFLNCKTLAAPGRAAETPAIFAPGIVSSETPEFGISFTPDGKTVFFNRLSADRKQFFLLQSTKTGAKWSKPVPPAFADSTVRDIDPFVTSDGTRLFFSANRPLPDGQNKGFNVWYVEKQGKNWGVPTPVGNTVNSADDEVFTSLSAAGNLYFARFSGRKAALYRSQWQNGAFQPAERLRLPVSDTASLSNPCISPDEKWLVFVSGELGGAGSADLFASRRLNDGSWSAPVNLGQPVNSPYAEFAPAFSPDGKILYFTSERPGVVQDFPSGQRRPGDIYSVAFRPPQ